MSSPRVHADFVATRWQIPWLGLALLAASLAIAGHLALRWRGAELSLHELDDAQALLGAPRLRIEPPRRELLEQRKAAERIVRALTVPWGQMIEALEGSAVKDVSILQLQPDANKRLLRITAATRNEDRMFQYLRAVSAAQGLSEAHLVSEQAMKKEPLRPIRFSLQASFREMR